MPLFRKKPVVIEAVQWNGNNFDEVVELTGIMGVLPPSQKNTCVGIQTLEGTMRADIGDWIIKGIKGEVYPCKPDIFEATYESI